MRNQRFGATQAYRQFHHLKMVEQRERLLLTALDVESESRAGRGTLPVEHRLPWIGLLEEAKIVPSRYFGVSRQVFGDETGVVVRASHADLERFKRAHQHPTRVRIELRADGAAPAHHLLHEAGVAADAASNEIAMATNIFGQRAQRDVCAAF